MAVVGQISRCVAGQTLEYQDGNLKIDTLSYWYPVELSQYRCDVITPLCTGYYPRGIVLHRLQASHQLLW